MGKLGFIGLGDQGGPIARRMIEAGHSVVLWARRSESLKPFTTTSATYADSIANLGAQVDYCAICVVDDAGVQQVCDQLIPAMKPGGIIVIHSTVHSDLCESLYGQARACNLRLVDAPVSGGGAAAAEGTLTVMAGGDVEAIYASRPIFKTFARCIVHLGAVGAGQKAKLVNNNLMAANVALAHHALEVAESLGIERDEFVKLVSASSGRSFAFDVCARMKAPMDFYHGAKLLKKDVALLGDLVGNNKDNQVLSDVANPFLDLALAE